MNVIIMYQKHTNFKLKYFHHVTPKLMRYSNSSTNKVIHSNKSQLNNLTLYL